MQANDKKDAEAEQPALEIRDSFKSCNSPMLGIPTEPPTQKGLEYLKFLERLALFDGDAF